MIERQREKKASEKKLCKEQLPVKLKLRAEPENEKDSMAIATDMYHKTGWFHLGYITIELTQYLHPLVLNDKIVDTSVRQIDNRVSFARIGYYPLIMITTKGKWENYVIVRCQSAR